MNIKRVSLFFLVGITALLLSGCSPTAQLVAWPGVTVGESMVYVADNQHVYGVNLADGVEAWRFPAKGEANKVFYAQPVLTDDGQLLVGDYKSGFYSLNPQTGAQNWQTPVETGKKVGSPLVADNMIYVPSGDRDIYQVDLQGNVVWQYKTQNGNWSKPVAGDAGIIFGSLDHFVYAVDFNARREVWKVDAGAAVVGTPTPGDNGLVYVGTLGREIVAINAADGKIAWRKSTNGAVWSGPAFNDGVIYFGDSTGMIYALEAANGAAKWSKQQEGGILGAPALLPNGVVFGTDSGVLVAYDFAGSVLWSRTIEGKLYGSPTFAKDRLFVPVNEVDALLQVWDKDGNLQWSFTPAK